MLLRFTTDLTNKNSSSNWDAMPLSLPPMPVILTDCVPAGMVTLTNLEASAASTKAVVVPITSGAEPPVKKAWSAMAPKGIEVSSSPNTVGLNAVTKSACTGMGDNANKAAVTAAATGNIEIRMLSCGPLSEFRFVCTCEALASVLTTELFLEFFNCGMFFICLFFLANVVRLIELIHKARSLRSYGIAKNCFLTDGFMRCFLESDLLFRGLMKFSLRLH